MNRFEQMINSLKKDTVFVAIGIIIIGLILAIFPSLASAIICYAVGVFLLTGGIFKIVEYFRTKTVEIFGSFGLVTGTILCVTGIVFIVNPTILAKIIVTLIAVVLIADGVLKIQYAINLSRVNANHWWIVLATGIAISLAGVIAMFSPKEVGDLFMRIGGIVLIIDGIMDLCTVFYASKAIRSFNDMLKENQALNVDAIPVDNEEHQ